MRRRQIIILASVFFLLQVALLVYTASIIESTGNVHDIVSVIGLIVFIAAVTFALTRYLFTALDRSEQAYIATLEDGLEESLANYLEVVHTQESESAVIARAIAGQIAQARADLEDNRTSELNSHLSQSLDLATQTSLAGTSNTAVAAILDYKTRQCAQAGVALDTQVALPESLSIPDVELVSLFFNLIDNALHECVALEQEQLKRSNQHTDNSQPTIHVLSRIDAGQLFIEVNNPCRSQRVALRPKERRLRTSGKHGWGIEIVTTTAKRYTGLAEFTQKGTVFTARVMIPVSSDSK